MNYVKSLWIDLKPYKTTIEAEGQRRFNEKQHYHGKNGTRELGGTLNGHPVGLCGEAGFDVTFGLPVKFYPASQGDGGADFWLTDGRSLDVKAATFLDDPDLKVDTDKLTADLYACVAVDYKNWKAYYLGWATKDEMIINPTQSYGNNPKRYWRKWNELHHEPLDILDNMSL